MQHLTWFYSFKTTDLSITVSCPHYIPTDLVLAIRMVIVFYLSDRKQYVFIKLKQCMHHCTWFVWNQKHMIYGTNIGYNMYIFFSMATWTSNIEQQREMNGALIQCTNEYNMAHTYCTIKLILIISPHCHLTQSYWYILK